MRKIAKLSTLLALGTLFTMPRGSFGQHGSDGGENAGPDGPPDGGSDGPPGGAAGLDDDAENVYCEEDGSSAHYAETLSGSGPSMMRYGASDTGCPNHVNWDLNPNSAQHRPTNESIPAYPMMFASGGTTDLSSTANAIGIMRNGVAMFSSWARDQVIEYEDTAFYIEGDTIDLCGGHSTAEGTYHYHSTAGCLQEQAMVQAGTSASEHSALLGWAYDGFPIYGQLGPDGVEMKMCGEEGASDTHCLDVCSGYEALIPDVDDFTYRYYTSCGFDESFFPFTTNCYRGCCPDGVTCSQKVEACGDSPENGYTADYVPTLTTPLDEQYDADLIAGDDTNFIGSKTSSVDCTLYMGSSSTSTTPSPASDLTPAPTTPEEATPSPVNLSSPAPVITSPPTPEPTPASTTTEATPSPVNPPSPVPVATSPPTPDATPMTTTSTLTPSPTDPTTPVPSATTQSPMAEPTPTQATQETTPAPIEPATLVPTLVSQPPTAAPTFPPAEPTASSTPLTSSSAPVEGSENGFVEVGTKTTVDVEATAYDVFPSGDSTGCGTLGCMSSLAHDGISSDIESRWSCKNIIVPDDGQCAIRFTFGQPMDLKDVQVAFWRVEERTRWLQIQINDDAIGVYESSPGSTFDSTFNSFGIEATAVESVTFESVGIDDGEWVSLLEVRFMVEP